MAPGIRRALSHTSAGPGGISLGALLFNPLNPSCSVLQVKRRVSNSLTRHACSDGSDMGKSELSTSFISVVGLQNEYIEMWICEFVFDIM